MRTSFLSREPRGFASCVGTPGSAVLGSAARSAFQSLSGTAAASGRSTPNTDLFDGQEEVIQRSLRGMWRPGHASADGPPHWPLPLETCLELPEGEVSGRDNLSGLPSPSVGPASLSDSPVEAPPLGEGAAAPGPGAASMPPRPLPSPGNGDRGYARGSPTAAAGAPCGGPGSVTSGPHLRRAAASDGEHPTPADAPAPAAGRPPAQHPPLPLGLGSADPSGASLRRQASVSTTLSMILSKGNGDTPPSWRDAKSPERKVMLVEPLPKPEPVVGNGTHHGGRHMLGCLPIRPTLGGADRPSQGFGSPLMLPAAAALRSQGPHDAETTAMPALVPADPLDLNPAPHRADGPAAAAGHDEWAEFAVIEARLETAPRPFPDEEMLDPLSLLSVRSSPTLSGVYAGGSEPGSGSLCCLDVPAAGLLVTCVGIRENFAAGSDAAGRPPRSRSSADRGTRVETCPSSAPALSRAWPAAVSAAERRRAPPVRPSMDTQRRALAEDLRHRRSVDSSLRATGFFQVSRAPLSMSRSASPSPGASLGSSGGLGRHAARALATELPFASTKAAGKRARASMGRRDSAYTRPMHPAATGDFGSGHASPDALLGSSDALLAGCEPGSASQRFKGMQGRMLSLIADANVAVLSRERSLHSSRRGSHIGQGGANAAAAAAVSRSRGGSFSSMRSYSTPTTSNSGTRRAASPLFWALAVTGQFSALVALCAYGVQLARALSAAADTLRAYAKAAAFALASAAFESIKHALKARPPAQFPFLPGSPSCTLHGGSSYGTHLVGLGSGTLHGGSMSGTQFAASRSGTLHGGCSRSSGALLGSESDVPPPSSSGRINLVTRCASLAALLCQTRPSLHCPPSIALLKRMRPSPHHSCLHAPRSNLPPPQPVSPSFRRPWLPPGRRGRIAHAPQAGGNGPTAPGRSLGQA